MHDALIIGSGFGGAMVAHRLVRVAGARRRGRGAGRLGGLVRLGDDLAARRHPCLWADTGHAGWFAFAATYQQAWTWVTEGGMFVVLAARCFQPRVWPFN